MEQKASAQTVLFRLYNDAIVPLFDDTTGKIKHYIFKNLILEKGQIKVSLKDGRKFLVTCKEE